jgi:phosphatidate cytidylyltransferase
VMIWRMVEGPENYVQDMSAGLFATLYLPFLASFVMLMLVPDDGVRRVILFFVVTVCSDVGAYAVGVRFGKNKMAPRISPGKTWEGLAGSVIVCMFVGALAVHFLLGGAWWHGVVVGVAIAISATLGDLAESVIKRDLGVKDMGNLLPGHGGIMDRLDSLLLTAPVAWLLLTLLVPAA